jgi:BirA family biotin operon repressor/biotin-[acetyl-CoA-carboxylase] ligase
MNFHIHKFETCTSTNDVAREMALRGAPEGTAVVAEEQTAGRGTKGRSWHSPRGKGLYVSLVLRPEAAEITLLPLAAGLAAREAVERSHGLSARLRWPNDILWEGKKLGGILCESGFLGNRPEYVILGVGLNVDHDLDDFPEDIRALAVSVRMAARRPADGGELLRCLLPELERWKDIHAGPAGGDEIIRTFERYSIFRKGDSVKVVDDEKTIQGVYQGIGHDGSLELIVENEPRRFSNAEIVRII